MRFSHLMASVVSASVVLAGLAATPVLAAEQAYSAAAMKAAQAAGKPIVIDVSATWCSTCAAQKPIVELLLKEPKFKNLVLFRIDYDNQKRAMRTFGVQERSTFVAFKGEKEVGRSTGDTDKASIEKLFDKTS